MKVGVLITAFNEPNIVNLIKHYKPYVDDIVVTVSKKPWKGDMKADDTYDRARSVTTNVINKHWPFEHQQRNEGMYQLRKMDYVIVSHCDTWFTAEDLKKLKEMELSDRHYTCKVLTYWKDLDTVIDPDISLPTIVIRADQNFENLINIYNMLAAPQELPITCYHLSWVKSDDELLKKISTYSHADEISREWFDNVWKKDNKNNLGPTIASDYKGLRKDPLPDEIRRYL